MVKNGRPLAQSAVHLCRTLPWVSGSNHVWVLNIENMKTSLWRDTTTKWASRTGRWTLALRLVWIQQSVFLPLRSTFKQLDKFGQSILDHHTAHTGCRQRTWPAGWQQQGGYRRRMEVREVEDGVSVYFLSLFICSQQVPLTGQGPQVFSCMTEKDTAGRQEDVNMDPWKEKCVHMKMKTWGRKVQ